MIRVKISNFIKRNKHKIMDLGVKLIIVAIIVFIATIMLSLNRNTSTDNNTINDTYMPKETVIQGSDITEEQYQNDISIVDKFLEYCNNRETEKAYELISDECKNDLYPSLDLFETNYCSDIFKEKREYNLQSWISTNQYTVYKIRYTTNMLESGKYDKNNVYQDYITLIKNSNEGKISLKNYIISENLSKETNTNEINAKVQKRYIYVSDEKYDLSIKNNTQNVIMLDSLETTNNIKIIGNIGGAYNAYCNKIFPSEITIQPGETKQITIEFKKPCDSNNKSKYIQFSKVIRNYDEYLKDKNNYTDTFNLKIEL